MQVYRIFFYGIIFLVTLNLCLYSEMHSKCEGFFEKCGEQ